MNDSTDRLVHSWEANAKAWTRAVRTGFLESRRVATDASIVEAVAAVSPARVLDAGCGEGWLARALAGRGIDVVGVDASASLIESAQAAGGGAFHQISYDELSNDPDQLGVSTFDAVVCNFSLLHEDIEPLLRSFAANLRPGGTLLIQTVHPWTARGEGGYVDGWRVEAFTSFGEEFVEPMPWYFRTLGSWTQALRASGFVIEQVLEPAHPVTHEPLSLLMIARRTA